MRKKIDFLAILLVILLALSLGLGAVSVYCDHAYRETLSSNNALGGTSGRPRGRGRAGRRAGGGEFRFFALRPLGGQGR